MRAALLLLLASCATSPTSPPEAPLEPGHPDVHSFARPGQVRVTAVDLDLTLDFDRSTVRGRAALDLERRDRTAPLILDTQDLTIEAVEGPGGDPRAHTLGTEDPVLGRPLAIALGPDDHRVVVHYRTAPDAAALQWLAPGQTAGGTTPFLYTQGQAILTRSWIPLQDSPGVRVTWTARVRAPEGTTVVMSAPVRRREDGAFTFDMELPVPPYLIALACGDIARRDLSPRCAVYAEPGVVDDAAAEFEDTPAMLTACEELYGPYRWGRYDVLVLPPAFPFGGMENPTLTFATPTILAGDKSLVALIAHELAHSWSGNLVTNATWRDFWLNEGFTVHLEQRIMEHVFGPERARMEILIGLRGLARELRELPAGDQRLHVDLTGRNPDDGMTAVAYDKGAAFLRRLEQVFGRERFDAFLAGYFDAHAFRSITTADFRAHLEEHLLATDPEAAAAIDVDEWIEGIGLPDGVRRPRSEAFAAVDRVVEGYLEGGIDPRALRERSADWVTHQWLHFVGALPADLEPERVAALDEALGLTRSTNAEILCAWLGYALGRGHGPAFPRARDFLLAVGRRKFLVPLYRALLATEDGRQRALEVYRRARPRYHAVAVRTLDGLLGWSP